MNSLGFATILVRFLALAFWLVALACCGLELVEWLRFRSTLPNALDDKYFIVATGPPWLHAGVIFGLLGVLVYMAAKPLARFLCGER